jgi:(1->4)-alpha-D-glucan 1-alpha-D-glucosylmutase
MSTPIATYRLQLRNGMAFADAAKLAPYFEKLGVSHIYLSPIFQAPASSTHGYDATSFEVIEPALGGHDGFIAMADAFARHQLKIIVDFVPNHMAAHSENAWWCDVLEWGEQSRCRNHFDIDWSAPKLLIPVLGRQFGECVSDKEITVDFVAAEGRFVIRYFDNWWPVDPRTYVHILRYSKSAELESLASQFGASTPETAAALKTQLAEKRDAVAAAVDGFLNAPSATAELLDAQVFRLAYWRTARELLTYRRFFEISDLIGVRVERPDVFKDVHSVILELVAQGKVDGLRIDHIDGLADPLKYLRDLRSATPDVPNLFLVVEKILGEGETLRREWPIDGTTGYEFIRDAGNLFVSEPLEVLEQGYDQFTRIRHDFAAETKLLKRRMLTFNLAAELKRLTSLASQIAATDPKTRDFGPDALRHAIVEIAASFQIYRTYVDPTGVSDRDAAVLDRVERTVKASRQIEDPSIIDFLFGLLRAPARTPLSLEFATRFQQTTGPLMAKAVEDTGFYRFNRLIGLNEVGNDPDVLTLGPAYFHSSMLSRQELTPRALTATATHDTKRGEDARTRFYALASYQETWIEAVERWHGLLAPSVGLTIDRNIAWMFYQALAGAWPEGGSPDPGFADRIVEFLIKAAREAKRFTTWTSPDEGYERALERFARMALETETFVADFKESIEPLIETGMAISLVQTVLKIFAPGIPDIYQGTELWDLALVDPDNRRPVDFGAREQFLGQSADISSAQCWIDGAIKLHLTARSLRTRAKADWTQADYTPLEIVGPQSQQIVAFSRSLGQQSLVVVGAIPRVGEFHFPGRGHPPHVSSRGQIVLPPHMLEDTWADALRETAIRFKSDRIDVSEVLGELPVAVLYSGS